MAKVEEVLGQVMSARERLAQAVLAKAFRGELVPTEAELARRDYVPATKLLERIKNQCVKELDSRPAQRAWRRRQ